MAEEVTVILAAGLNVKEVGDAADFPASTDERDRTINHNANDVASRFQTGNTLDPEAVTSKDFTATATLDLTAAPKSGGGTQDLTGMKLLSLQLRTPDDNAAAVTIEPGAANPYNFLGLANGQGLDLPPGFVLTLSYEDKDAVVAVAQTPAVAAGAKNITVTISGSDELHLTAVFGNT
jgi:hypothetical protein